jgi:hypothetical protein
MWSALPVFRNWTAASKVDGEHRFSDSRRAASSSGANGFVVTANAFVTPEYGGTESDIGRSLYVAVGNKVNPFLAPADRALVHGIVRNVRTMACVMLAQ